MRMRWPASCGEMSTRSRARLKSSSLRERISAAESVVTSSGGLVKARLRAARGGASVSGEGRGGEEGVVAWSGEGQVHLGGTAAEESRSVEVKAGVLAGFGGD